MKAKALLLLGLVGGGAALAQTVSQNIVGYVNVKVPGQVGGVAKYIMASNPLVATSNKVSDVIKLGASDDLTLYHYTAAGFVPSTFSSGDCVDGCDTIIEPGGGFFAASGSANDVKITFVGEVGIAKAIAGHNVPAGLSIQSSILPKSASLKALEFPVGAGGTDSDAVFQFVGGAYVESGASAGDWLVPDENGPVVGVAEAFWVKRTGTAALWKQASASLLLQ